MKTSLLMFLVGGILAAVVIYFSPLQYLPILEPTIRDINATEFAHAFAENPDDYIFLDVRPANVYDDMHAQGSQSMPLHTLYDERHILPKSGKTIVLICSGGKASGVGYHYLEHFGFTNVRRIEGGIEAWVLEKLPTEGKSLQKLLP